MKILFSLKGNDILNLKLKSVSLDNATCTSYSKCQLTWCRDGGCLLEGELPVGEDPWDEAGLGAPVVVGLLLRAAAGRARPHADLLDALHVPLAHVEPTI